MLASPKSHQPCSAASVGILVPAPNMTVREYLNGGLAAYAQALGVGLRLGEVLGLIDRALGGAG